MKSASIRAVLGPTNTGKTYLAVERMTAQPTGMIGFPLRLLARENYDRIAARHGRASVALITGEEKLIPPNPRWYVCTVEAMPLERRVDFLAVDEIQLCADPERGHVFTDRLMRARGLSETMFLGSDSMNGMVRALVSTVSVETRPRFSTLRWAGDAKLNRLPRRSAIVAFSVDQVYQLAEGLRRQRGGTAVVLGALSPRTRNAQVAMYQAGEVDYLVATDAIGMGLNMDVDHVAFAALRKYDGQRLRPLAAPEMGQIAGRAGRHMNDGTFGVTNDRPPPDEDIIRRIEEHDYPPIRRVHWRNTDLDFASPKRLLQSLAAPATRPELSRARDADDHLALAALVRDDAVMVHAGTRDHVHLLWDVCQVPDFRKVMADHHATLLARIFTQLCENDRELPEDWVAGQIERLNRTEGDIDTLTNRISHIRTWTYIAHRGDWLRDSAHWQARTRGIEDALSDALHEALIQRFVDRRAAALGKDPKASGPPETKVGSKGDVSVEGHVIGHLEGLRFVPHDASDMREARALLAAAGRAIQEEAPRIVSSLEEADDQEFGISPEGQVTWRGRSIGRLLAGESRHRPAIKLARDTFLSGDLEDRVRSRLQAYLDRFLERRLGILVSDDAGTADILAAAGRGILYHLREGFGTCPRRAVSPLLNNLGKAEWAELKRLGMRTGLDWVYLDNCLTTRAVRARALLWSAWHGVAVPETPSVSANAKRAVMLLRSDDMAAEAWPAIGYVRLGASALRIDRYEALTANLRRQKNEPVTCDAGFMAGLGIREKAEAIDLFAALGYRPQPGAAEDAPLVFEKSGRKNAKRSKTKKVAKRPSGGARKRRTVDPNSPFAVLKDWGGAK